MYMPDDGYGGGGCCCGTSYGSGIANGFASWFERNFDWAEPAVEWHQQTTSLANQWVQENLNGQSVIESVASAVFGNTVGALIQSQTLNQGASGPPPRSLTQQERDSIYNAISNFSSENQCN